MDGGRRKDGGGKGGERGHKCREAYLERQVYLGQPRRRCVIVRHCGSNGSEVGKGQWEWK